MSSNDDLVNLLLDCVEPEESNTRDAYVRSPIPYPGNKFESLSYIIPILPEGNTFIDGCGGSGVITLNLVHKYPLRVFNDRHSGVTSFYRCIREYEKCEALIQRLDLTVHSREEFIWARDTWEDSQLDDVERAARWYYSIAHSFSALGRNFARSTTGRAQSDDALHNKLPMLRMIRARFAGIQVENQDVLQCLRDYATDRSVAYIDPDYLDTDPGIYRHRVAHENLLDFIASSRGYFAVSGYSNELYDRFQWDEVKKWPVSSSMRSQVYNDGNGLKGKENHMQGWEQKEECLYIRDFR